MQVIVLAVAARIRAIPFAVLLSRFASVVLHQLSVKWSAKHKGEWSLNKATFKPYSFNCHVNLSPMDEPNTESARLVKKTEELRERKRFDFYVRCLMSTRSI